MPSQRTGGGYCEWAVIDTERGNEVRFGELTRHEAEASADRMNQHAGFARYAVGRFIAPNQYEQVKRRSK